MSNGLLTPRDEKVLSLAVGIALVGFVVKGLLGGIVGFVTPIAVSKWLEARQKGMI